MTEQRAISPIQELANVGNYKEGLEAYYALPEPTSNDDRWAAICLWNSGRLEDAKIMFTKAARHGENGALIGLASIYRLLGDLDACEAHLNAACATSLSPDDWVRALREHGDLHFFRNRNKSALDSYLKARLEAELCKDAETLIPMIDQSLGVVYHLLGNHRKAEEHFSQALLTINPTLQLYVRIGLIYIYIFIGNFSEAKNQLFHSEFESIDNLYFFSLYLNCCGTFHTSQKNWKSAYSYFEKSVELAEKNHFIEIDCLSKLGICKTYIGSNQINKARVALKRVDNLSVSPEYIAARELTAGVLWINLGELEKAHQYLLNAKEYYQSHDMARELAWTHLHLAMWHLKNGDAQGVNEHLETVADIAGMLGGNKFLLLELRLIQDYDIAAMAAIATPYALHALEPALEDLETTTPEQPTVREYSFQTFGKPELLLNGTKMQLNSMAKTLELLAYLLLHPKSTLEKILTDVFEESAPKAARNHFHQIKHQFGLALDGLEITYDREDRTYSVKLEGVNLIWDYAEIMQILDLSSGAKHVSEVTVQKMNQAITWYKGAFLAFSDNEWVREVQQRVEWLLIHTGLKVVQRLFDAKDFKTCQTMIEHLRAINPFDENLNTLLVLSASKLDGALVGQHRIAQIEQVFQQHNEMLPATLQNLKTNLKKLN